MYVYVILYIYIYIYIYIYNCSHKDDYNKRHDKRNESSRFLWKYGVIQGDHIPFHIPFMIIECQEHQCQYGHVRKHGSVKEVWLQLC